MFCFFVFYTLVSAVLQEVVFREDSEKNGLGVAPRSCFGVQGGCFLSSLSEGSSLSCTYQHPFLFCSIFVCSSLKKCPNTNIDNLIVINQCPAATHSQPYNSPSSKKKKNYKLTENDTLFLNMITQTVTVYLSLYVSLLSCGYQCCCWSSVFVQYWG